MCPFQVKLICYARSPVSVKRIMKDTIVLRIRFAAIMAGFF